MSEIPTTADIVGFLREGCGDFVIHVPSGQRIQPEEIWIPGLGCWVRADGFSVYADYGRGYRYPGIIERWRIRRAVNRFRQLVDEFPARLSETTA